MQRVQTFIRFAWPFTSARTDWMLGFQRREDRRCEWETCFPKLGPRPQTSHTAAMGPRMVAASMGPDNKGAGAAGPSR